MLLRKVSLAAVLGLVLAPALAGCSDAEATTGSGTGSTATAGHAWTLALQPFGDIDEEAIDTVRTTIEKVYGWKIVTLESEDLPAEAWYKPRKRYRAEKILVWLADHMPPGADRIMGLTRKDISTTKPPVEDWGICGLADLDGPTAVVSTFRIKKKLGKIPPAKRKEKYLQRLRDLASHEFGHTLGLPHCPTKGCVMEDAKGTVLTFDHSTSLLCDECLALLAEAGFTLP